MEENNRLYGNYETNLYETNLYEKMEESNRLYGNYETNLYEDIVEYGENKICQLCEYPIPNNALHCGSKMCELAYHAKPLDDASRRYCRSRIYF